MMIKPKYHHKQLRLGEFIDLLKSLNPFRHHGSDKSIVYDFCHLTPSGLDSYRGYYEDLAIGWSDDKYVTPNQLYAALEIRIGVDVAGWKGGYYAVNRDQLLWVANPGRTGSTIITGIKDHDSIWVIKTKTIDD